MPPGIGDSTPYTSNKTGSIRGQKKRLMLDAIVPYTTGDKDGLSTPESLIQRIC